AKKFAVTLKYYGARADSCYFIYGFPNFVAGGCTFGSATLANPTSYNTIHASTPFVANSFTLWTEYSSYGTLPDKTGANVFYPCNGDANYVQGTDGDNFYQDINIFPLIDLDPNGINEVNSPGFSVAQNYPNPFSVQTQINYNLTKSSDVVFSVYDMTGRELMNNSLSTVAPGQHVINISANKFSPGVYMYTFNVNGNIVTKRMVITQ
ncbi:MAG TPA: T9SS type A sorting domain-containing protein, partial [Bacteroidia bacterium]|nr:T9SS type A sorting domain-containing protein [Bacteroidia bacterium]